MPAGLRAEVFGGNEIGDDHRGARPVVQDDAIGHHSNGHIADDLG